MLFSSMTFIYVFMPIVCISYLLIKPELKNYLLLIASIIFMPGANRVIWQL